MDFAVRIDVEPARKSAFLRFGNLLKDRQLAQSLFGVPKKIEIFPWHKNANHRRKNQPPNVRSGKSQPNGRSNRLRRFSSVLKKKCTRSAAHATRGCRQTKGLRCLTRLISKTRNTRTYFFRRRRQAQPDLGGVLTPILFCLPLELQRHAEAIFEACACTRG